MAEVLGQRHAFGAEELLASPALALGSLRDLLLAECALELVGRVVRLLLATLAAAAAATALAWCVVFFGLVLIGLTLEDFIDSILDILRKRHVYFVRQLSH